MIRDTVRLPNIQSTFLSCEKDTETIIKKLFVENQPFSDYLKRLLVINTPDCLDGSNEEYRKIIKDMSVSKLIKEGYVRFNPKIRFEEHEEIKSYLIVTFENFIPNSTNTEFRDCIINIAYVSHLDYWDIGDYQLRPYKVAGYVDGILNKAKLSGIGELNFMEANWERYNEDFYSFFLVYRAVHMTEGDDAIPPKEDN